MLATSTHDTKRSEDVRARLAVLSEIPDIWQQKVFAWSRINRSRKVRINEDYAPDLNDEYLIYQTILGACPLELFAAKTDQEIQPIVNSFKERIEAYILKAAREAKTYTSWINQNKDYENALIGFVEKILTPSSTNAFLQDFKVFAARLSELGLVNALVQTLIKLTSPGVPDTYQGCELWDFSLVDPDNRRPVDFQLRANMLEGFGELQIDAPFNGDRKALLVRLNEQFQSGASKLFVTASLLNHRKAHPELFTKGRYIPLSVAGEKQENVIAYAREYQGEWLFVFSPLIITDLLGLTTPEHFSEGVVLERLRDPNLWGDTTVAIPKELKAKSLRHLFSQKEINISNQRLKCADLFADFPVTVLILA